MKSLMLVLLTSASIAFSACVAFAQPGGGGGGRGTNMNPEKEITELIAQLDVTADQEEGFRQAMMQIAETRMAGMRQGGGRRNGGDDGAQSQERTRPNAEEMAERRAQMQAQEEEILAAVLDAGQIGKYREIQQARMAEMMERRDRR